jgi:hypothetical protein
MDLDFEYQTLRIYEQMAISLPLTFLAPSYPLSPPTPAVFTDWLSTMPPRWV